MKDSELKIELKMHICWRYDTHEQYINNNKLIMRPHRCRLLLFVPIWVLEKNCLYYWYTTREFIFWGTKKKYFESKTQLKGHHLISTYHVGYCKNIDCHRPTKKKNMENIYFFPTTINTKQTTTTMFITFDWERNNNTYLGYRFAWDTNIMLTDYSR